MLIRVTFPFLARSTFVILSSAETFRVWYGLEFQIRILRIEFDIFHISIPLLYFLVMVE